MLSGLLASDESSVCAFFECCTKFTKSEVCATNRKSASKLVSPSFFINIMCYSRFFEVKPSPRERVHCFEEKTGKVLWVFGYKENYLEWTFVPERGAGPTATPIVEQDRIFVVGAYGHVHCLDVKKGTVIWEKHIGREYEVAEMSCRPSPLIEGSLLI